MSSKGVLKKMQVSKIDSQVKLFHRKTQGMFFTNGRHTLLFNMPYTNCYTLLIMLKI